MHTRSGIHPEQNVRSRCQCFWRVPERLLVSFQWEAGYAPEARTLKLIANEERMLAVLKSASASSASSPVHAAPSEPPWRPSFNAHKADRSSYQKQRDQAASRTPSPTSDWGALGRMRRG